MRGYIVFDSSYPTQVAAIADAINTFFQHHGVSGTADWYYDDDNIDYGTEYGIKMDIFGSSPFQAIDWMRSIWQLLSQEYTEQEVRLEIAG